MKAYPIPSIKYWEPLLNGALCQTIGDSLPVPPLVGGAFMKFRLEAIIRLVPEVNQKECRQSI